MVSNKLHIGVGLYSAFAVSFLSCSSSTVETSPATQPVEISLTPKTKQYLDQVDDVVSVTIYLTGENLTHQLKAIERAAREQLKEFKAYLGGKFVFNFVAPFDEFDPNEAQRFLEENDLYLAYFAWKNEHGNEQVTRFVPGGTISYKGNTAPFYILGPSRYTEESLGRTLQTMNYETILANTIRSLVLEKPKLAILQGHGELDHRQSWVMETMLKKYYTVERVSIAGDLKALEGYDGLIVAKPTERFDQKDIFVIDQFIMNGGKTAWFIDPIDANEDTLTKRGQTIGLKQDLGLDIPLFTYGVRLMDNLVLDQECAVIPILTETGQRPEIKPFYFHPLLTGNTIHTITSSIKNPIRGRYTSSITAIEKSKATKTVLLTTQNYSKQLQAPVRIGYGITNISMNPEMFPVSDLPVAMLLEGEFDSAYKNRLTEDSEFKDGFKEESIPTKMVVVADGDIVRNDIVPRPGKEGTKGELYIELQFDLFNQDIRYGNGDFILNTIDYLMEQ